MTPPPEIPQEMLEAHAAETLMSLGLNSADSVWEVRQEARARFGDQHESEDDSEEIELMEDDEESDGSDRPVGKDKENEDEDDESEEEDQDPPVNIKFLIPVGEGVNDSIVLPSDTTYKKFTNKVSNVLNISAKREIAAMNKGKGKTKEFSVQLKDMSAGTGGGGSSKKGITREEKAKSRGVKQRKHEEHGSDNDEPHAQTMSMSQITSKLMLLNTCKKHGGYCVQTTEDHIPVALSDISTWMMYIVCHFDSSFLPPLIMTINSQKNRYPSYTIPLPNIRLMDAKPKPRGELTVPVTSPPAAPPSASHTQTPPLAPPQNQGIVPESTSVPVHGFGPWQGYLQPPPPPTFPPPSSSYSNPYGPGSYYYPPPPAYHSYYTRLLS
ncbi:hypothetical protein PM082_009478 [Marasmius tenuissimus]|nr:hypothetical protein PM082_009478 [Marasmius tenuissimus]